MDNLQKLFCSLVLYDYNIRILHWKVNGLDFGTKHELMDEYHQELCNMTDDIGEIIMMTGRSIPFVIRVLYESSSFKEVNELTESDETESYVMLPGMDQTYDATQVITNTKKMFDHLVTLYQKLCDCATEDNCLSADIVNKLQEHQYWLRKRSFI